MTEVKQPDSQDPKKEEDQKNPEAIAADPVVDQQAAAKIAANIAAPRSETAKQASAVLDKQELPKLPDGLIFDPEGAKRRYEYFKKERVAINAMPFGEFDALRMVFENKQPMDATKALEVLKKSLGFSASEEQIRERFSNLNGFKGQVYLHATDSHYKTYVYVTGVEDEKIAFTLECNIFDYDGIVPIARIDEQDPPDLPKELRDMLRRDRRETARLCDNLDRGSDYYEHKVLEMLVANPRPMKATEALKVLAKYLGGGGESEEVIIARLPNLKVLKLKGFEGEIYLDGKGLDHISGNTVFHIIGIEKGETKFKLEYAASSRNGITARKIWVDANLSRTKTTPESNVPPPGKTEEFGTWAPESATYTLAEKRLEKNRDDGENQRQAYRLITENRRPISAEEAITQMSKQFDLSREDLLIRFPDLRGFEGEVYFDFNMTNIQVGGTSLEIHGGKNNKQVFVLDCMAFDNGWFPIVRNGQKIVY